DYARFDPASCDAAWLHEIDLWALGQLNQVIRDVTAAYERFEFYRVCQRIYQFVSVELSSLYLDVLKDRLYAESPDSPGRRAAQFVLARLHDGLTRLLAPIIPHTAQESVVTVTAAAADLPLLEANRELLATLCIVSEIKFAPAASAPAGPDRFSAAAVRAPHAKCERCWNYRPSVGQSAEHPTLCDRCVSVIRG